MLVRFWRSLTSERAIRLARRQVIVLFFAGGAGYASWRGQERLAITAVILLFVVLGSAHIMRLFNLCVDLLSTARQAKYGAIEIQLGKQLRDLSELAVRKSVGIQMLLSQLDGPHVALLLAVYRAGLYAPQTEAIRQKLRDLRDLGLLSYDGPTLAESAHVRVSAYGEEVARVLSEPPSEVQNIGLLPSSESGSSSKSVAAGESSL